MSMLWALLVSPVPTAPKVYITYMHIYKYQDVYIYTLQIYMYAQDVNVVGLVGALNASSTNGIYYIYVYI